MPVALKVDWSAVKTHCVAHGIPDAAKRYGITQEAIRQRCHREGWKDNPAIAEALMHQGFVSRSVTSQAKNPAALLAEGLKDKILRTRANHAETALIASADMLTLAEENPSAFRDPDNAGVLMTLGKHAALTGSWQSNTATPKINLHITGAGETELGLESGAPVGQTFDAEWTEQHSTDINDY